MRIQTVVLAIGIGCLVFGAIGVEGRVQSKSQADKLFARATPDDFMGDEGCASCHAEKSANFKTSAHAAVLTDPKAPLDKQGCEGCHGPGNIHQADENPEVISFRKMTPKESSAACLRCHQQTLSEAHWKRSAHARGDMSCVSCHQIHPDSDPDLGNVGSKARNPKTAVFVAKVEPKGLLRADEATLCGQCHAGQVAEFRLSSHHPIPEGRMLCSDCHNAHPTKNDKLRQTATKDACVSCHSEYAGPFVHEHDPVAGFTGRGCAECHKPHGSHNPKMLNSFSRGLCAQCHTEKLSTHYPGRTCWTAGCHVASHGSNTDGRFLQP